MCSRRLCIMRETLAPIVLAASILSSCSSSSLDEATHVRVPILGGEVVAPGAWPGVVWLDVGCTGVLLDETTVVYAAHCGVTVNFVWVGDAFDIAVDDAGIVTTAVDGNGQAIPVSYCEAHPRAELASGTDVAFCRLAAPAMARDVLPFPMLECERPGLALGRSLTLVGFGLDPDTNTYGRKRATTAKLERLHLELVVGDELRGTCDGDSGGPAFVNTAASASSDPHWRLLGILSSGAAEEPCGAGNYVDLTGVRSWLEETARRDFTPCSDDEDAWVASPRCVDARLDVQGRALSSAPRASDACGPRFEELVDTSPPEILDVAVGRSSSATLGPAIDVHVEVRDVGWGVARVVLQQLNASGEVLSSHDTERFSARFMGIPLSIATESLRLTAIDHAGLTDTWTQAMHSSADGGCSFAIRRFRPSSVLIASMVAIAGQWLRRRVTSNRHPRRRQDV
jgi:hypothetical protein